MKKTTKLTAMLLAVVMALTMIPTAFASDTISFSDVSENAWYYDNVMAMTEAGYINGYTDGTFKPDEYITNAELASLFSKAFLGESLKEEVNGYGFLDTVLEPNMTTGTTDVWWAEYVAALGTEYCYLGTNAGMNIPYTPLDLEIPIYDWDAQWASANEAADTYVTRSDLFTIAGNLFLVGKTEDNLKETYPDLVGADYDGHPLFAIYDEYEAQYSDWDEVKTWQTTVLLEVGIVKGSSDNFLNAGGYLTRAEVVTILSRLVNCDIVVKDSYEAYAEEIETSSQYDSSVSGSYDMTRYTVPADFDKDGILTEDEVQQMLDQLQEMYPDCSSLADALGDLAITFEGDDAIYYKSSVLNPNWYGGNCIAWAYFASDCIFGDLPVVYYEPGEWAETDLRIGDVVIDVYHTDLAISNAWWDDYDGVYLHRTSDSSSGLEITWAPTASGSNLTRKISTATLATRYPF